MKNWFHNNYKTLIISAFLIPIITVAVVSISHVTQWYGISNPLTWAVYLSIGVEIAALSALAAISADMGRKVYFPFGVVTLIQFIGNIFFAYSFINVNGTEFKQWVELSSPLVELFGVESTDLIGHKRFLAFFAGGMLPIISLSFLHMLVKFTEGNSMPVEPQKIDASDLIGEVSRLRLSQDDMEILERTLMNPPQPSENLQQSTTEYKEKMKSATLKEEWALNDEEILNRIKERKEEEKKRREELLVEMMQKDQELGLYDELYRADEISSTIEPELNNADEIFSTMEPESENILHEEEKIEDVEIPDVDETWDVGTEPLVTPTLQNDEDIDLKKKL